MATQTMDFEVKKPVQSETLVSRTPFDLMSQAIAQGISAEQLQILQEMHFRSLNRQAEIEFNEALNRVQIKIPRIVPELSNNQTNSKYASYAAIDKVVRPIYTEDGFSLSFNTADCPIAEHQRILAYLSRGSHTRTYQIDMPADGKGAKGGDVMTKTHAAAAANTYGKRYLICDIFNIPVGPDVDGNTFDKLNEELKKIAEAKDAASLQTIFKAAYKAAFTAKAEEAMKKLVAAKDNRKKELGKQHGEPLEWAK